MKDKELKKKIEEITNVYSEHSLTKIPLPRLRIEIESLVKEYALSILPEEETPEWERGQSEPSNVEFTEGFNETIKQAKDNIEG